MGSGCFSNRLKLHFEAELGELGNQTLGLCRGGAAIEVIGSSVAAFGAVYWAL